MDTDINKKRILLALLRNISKRYTLTALAEEIKMTRMGAWKIIKKLEAEKMIKITSLGKGRTSTQEMTLNWDNVLLENTLSNTSFRSEELYFFFMLMGCPSSTIFLSCNIAILSQILSISLSNCVVKIIVVPCFFILKIKSSICVLSKGSKSAVGSSIIKTSGL